MSAENRQGKEKLVLPRVVLAPGETRKPFESFSVPYDFDLPDGVSYLTISCVLAGVVGEIQVQSHNPDEEESLETKYFTPKNGTREVSVALVFPKITLEEYMTLREYFIYLTIDNAVYTIDLANIFNDEDAWLVQQKGENTLSITTSMSRSPIQYKPVGVVADPTVLKNIEMVAVKRKPVPFDE